MENVEAHLLHVVGAFLATGIVLRAVHSLVLGLFVTANRFARGCLPSLLVKQQPHPSSKTVLLSFLYEHFRVGVCESAVGLGGCARD